MNEDDMIDKHVGSYTDMVDKLLQKSIEQSREIVRLLDENRKLYKEKCVFINQLNHQTSLYQDQFGRPSK